MKRKKLFRAAVLKRNHRPKHSPVPHPPGLEIVGQWDPVVRNVLREAGHAEWPSPFGHARFTIHPPHASGGHSHPSAGERKSFSWVLRRRRRKGPQFLQLLPLRTYDEYIVTLDVTPDDVPIQFRVSGGGPERTAGVSEQELSEALAAALGDGPEEEFDYT